MISKTYAEGEVSLCTADCNGQCGESSYFEYAHKSVVEGEREGLCVEGCSLRCRKVGDIGQSLPATLASGLHDDG